MTRYILFIAINLLTLTVVSAQCVGDPGQIKWHYFGDLPYYDMEQMYVHESYPNGPDQIKVLNSVASPFNYNDMYGSVMKGFLSVPTSGPVTFNITGDDNTIFYLSTNASSNNLVERAYINGWTGREEHDKYPSQTSVALNLNAGQLYYFEVHLREGGGGDHSNLFWRNDFISQSEWVLVSSQYLTDVCDTICPEEGTPCNDGNANTHDDIQDGNCNCVGSRITSNTCIGERGKLQAYFYEGIQSGQLVDLYADPDYPTMPDQLIVNQNGLQADWSQGNEEYGMLIQGYLTVPVSGNYQFNLTGAMNVRFKLSSNSEPANVDNTIIEIDFGSGVLQHDNSPSQTSGLVSLSRNSYYYFELHHASPNWGHHHSVFWKGPNHSDNNWHRIPALNLYDYTCELACLPNGYACNDGDPYTANDQIVNCNCTGTPCGGNTGVACDDPLALYESFDYCEATYELDNREDDAWLSCNAGPNPHVSQYTNNHWIHYDLGSVYAIQGTHVWNYNVPGQTNRGFRNVMVDYSIDGNTWFNLGQYTFPYASGNTAYPGIVGPNFNGQSARYVMLTSLDNPGSCRGLSKVTFDVESCPTEGTECDDGFNSTFNDHYNRDCECIGYTSAELDCQVDTLYISEANSSPTTYHAVKALLSNGEALTSSNVNYKAGMQVVLQSGFEVSSGAEFLADIEDCGGSAIMTVEGAAGMPKELKSKKRPSESLHIYALESMEAQTVHFYLPQATKVKLDILDHKGNERSTIIIHKYQNFGDQYKRVQTKKLEPGVYLVRLTTESNVFTEKMTVL